MPFADELIGPDAANALVHAIQVAAPESALTSLHSAVSELGQLSLRERSDLLRDALLTDLPGDYASFAAVMRRAKTGTPPFSGWLIWPVTSAVAVKAVQDTGVDAFDDALALLAELTPRLTSEFAIRTLLDHDLGRALEIVQGWTASEDDHVRRLASEGTRAFLPWAIRVPGLLANPRATLPIISALYRDPSEYVRRSVANHLNDLSRQQPELVVETARAWLDAPDEHTARVVAHGLRTVVKRGDQAALALLGFTPAESILVSGPTLHQSTVDFGGSVQFDLSITNAGPAAARLAIDYIVHHQKANGAQTSKTFKLATTTLGPGESFERRREHSFRVITTRRYHPGAHAIEVQVNGVVSGRADFDLLPGIAGSTHEVSDR